MNKELTKKLEDLKQDVADQLLAYLFEKILSGNPVEDGHAHEAWISAILKTNGQFQKLFKVMDHFENLRSHDAMASKFGKAEVSKDAKSLTVKISNYLPFVRKLEYGIPIKVGDGRGNQGRKENPVKRPPDKGPLYGGRRSGKEGLLVFEKGGKMIKTKVWTPSGQDTGFVQRSVKETISYANSKGLKVKRIR